MLELEHLSKTYSDGTRALYLLQTPDAAGIGFTGDAQAPNLPAGAMVICHACDMDGAAFRSAGGGAHGAAQQLAPAALDAFLRRHPDALLVDVREPFECEAGACRLHGRAALELPLSRLAEHLPHLLAAPERPLVFVCRSGNRSARAALAMHRAGHAQAWTLAGGIALAV